MLDVANRDASYASAIPDGGFSELRRSDPDQHRYLLGDRRSSTNAMATATPPISTSVRLGVRPAP